jgi:hypothetical protein
MNGIKQTLEQLTKTQTLQIIKSNDIETYSIDLNNRFMYTLDEENKYHSYNNEPAIIYMDSNIKIWMNHGKIYNKADYGVITNFGKYYFDNKKIDFDYQKAFDYFKLLSIVNINDCCNGLFNLYKYYYKNKININIDINIIDYLNINDQFEWLFICLYTDYDNNCDGYKFLKLHNITMINNNDNNNNNDNIRRSSRRGGKGGKKRKQQNIQIKNINNCKQIKNINNCKFSFLYNKTIFNKLQNIILTTYNNNTDYHEDNESIINNRICFTDSDLLILKNKIQTELTIINKNNNIEFNYILNINNLTLNKIFEINNLIIIDYNELLQEYYLKNNIINEILCYYEVYAVYVNYNNNTKYLIINLNNIEYKLYFNNNNDWFLKEENEQFIKDVLPIHYKYKKLQTNYTLYFNCYKCNDKIYSYSFRAEYVKDTKLFCGKCINELKTKI